MLSPGEVYLLLVFLGCVVDSNCFTQTIANSLRASKHIDLWTGGIMSCSCACFLVERFHTTCLLMLVWWLVETSAWLLVAFQLAMGLPIFMEKGGYGKIYVSIISAFILQLCSVVLSLKGLFVAVKIRHNIQDMHKMTLMMVLLDDYCICANMMRMMMLLQLKHDCPLQASIEILAEDSWSVLEAKAISAPNNVYPSDEQNFYRGFPPSISQSPSAAQPSYVPPGLQPSSRRTFVGQLE